jgi:uncharacterized repeat protein (TIGR01451 family)
MSAFKPKLFRLIGLLFVILTLAAFNAKAALPDAGTAIGTVAVVEFEIDGEKDQSVSNIVTTTIAQVFATKIETVAGIVGKAGEEVDVRFSVRNIGNGADDLKLSIADSADNVKTFALMSADANSAADASNRRDMKMGDTFERKSIARDEVRHFIARIVVPAGTTENMQFVVKASNKGNKEAVENITVHIVDGKAFTVTPGANVTLDKGQALVEFLVKGGTEPGAGYFELIVAKKDAPDTPVKFTVQNQKIVFADQDVASSAITTDGTNVTAFRVSDIAVNTNTSFKMGIQIDDAKLGDEYVMVVKYAKDKSDTLTQSQAMQIAYGHTMLAPELKVIANSANPKASFEIVPSAVSGETVDYTMTLQNKSSRSEGFSLELARLANADAIDNMWMVDASGDRIGSAGGSGLPETGLIPAGQAVTFHLKVSLKHGIAADIAKQELGLTVKSITHPKTARVEQKFSIDKIERVQKPLIEFFSDMDGKNRVTSLNLPSGDDVASFYMRVATPKQSGAALREYQIRFNSPNTTFERVGSKTAVNPVSSMSARVGNDENAGMFLVKTTMRGVAKLTAMVKVVDVLSNQVEIAAIELTKGISVGFVKTGYTGKGSPDLDTVVTVDVINYGRAVAAGEIEMHAPVDGEWGFSFSVNGKDWQENLPLPKMDVLGKQAVQVKIRVPKGIQSGAIQSVQLALRKLGSDDNEATVFVKLNIGKSKLRIEKTVAVVKNGAAGPKAFSVNSTQDVEHGDTIWYRVVVTNPIDAPVARNVKIIDTLPKHVKFAASAAGADQAEYADGKVSMGIGDMQPGDSKTMEYSVTVELSN